MAILTPSYYKHFRCIADQCRHSCCIGWEIDVDEDTMRLYDDPQTPLHDRLCQHIDRNGTPHFRLTVDEYCPFLTKTGLCEIILHMGEGGLCQICADHPRFRHEFADHMEIGLGLCCEAAAELILFAEDQGWDNTGDAETIQDDEAFLTLRERIYTVLAEHIPLSEKLHTILSLCDSPFPQKTVAEWADVYRHLEQLDPTWDTMLVPLTKLDISFTLPSLKPMWEIPLTNLTRYFAFRHLADARYDGRLSERAAFCVTSTILLAQLFTVHHAGREKMCELSRLYSSEIEYDEDNVETLLDLLGDDQ